MQQSTEPTFSVSLAVRDAAAALNFSTEAIGANKLFRLSTPDGGIARAQIGK